MPLSCFVHNNSSSLPQNHSQYYSEQFFFPFFHIIFFWHYIVVVVIVKCTKLMQIINFFLFLHSRYVYIFGFFFLFTNNIIFQFLRTHLQNWGQKSAYNVCQFSISLKTCIVCFLFLAVTHEEKEIERSFFCLFLIRCFLPLCCALYYRFRLCYMQKKTKSIF